MFGASLGRRRGSTRCLYTESCIVRPAMLADGVGGNGSTSCAGSRGHADMACAGLAFGAGLLDRPGPGIGPWPHRHSRPV